MKAKNALIVLVVGLVSGWPPAIQGDARSQEKPAVQVQIPKPGVPEIMTMEGKFVRAAYNNEGYVILGYQLANRSIGEDWMLLEVGVTVLDRTPDFRIRREAFSLELPDGKTLPLPTVSEHREGDTRALQNREKVQRDSINYFPPSATRACGLTFFPDLTSRAMPGTRSSSATARVSRPALLQDSRRGRIRPALAQREVRAEPRARTLQNPHQGGREAAGQELQIHQQAGQGRLQAEEEVREASHEVASWRPHSAAVSPRRTASRAGAGATGRRECCRTGRHQWRPVLH